MTIGKRIKELRGQKTQAEFSRATGIPKNTLGRYERGEIVPGGDAVALLCKSLKVDPGWLLFGEGPMHRAEALDRVPARTPARADHLSEDDGAKWVGRAGPYVTMIPKARPFLVDGSLHVDKDPDHLPFISGWLSTKGDPRRMVLVDVAGDDLAPEIKHGDAILVDQSQVAVLPGRIYAVAIDQGVVIRRVNVSPGKMILSGFNKACEPLIVGQDEMSSIKVVGRVVWSARDY